MDPQLRREIILNNYQNPYHKGFPEDDENYIRIRTNNESCIDDLTILLKVEDGVIQKIYFEGDACAISTSATSIMASQFEGKTLPEAKSLLEEYEAMLDEKPYHEEVLEELNAYDEIYKQPNRKKCALLPFRAIHEVLKQNGIE